ncbi:MAG: iron-sulfur cluster assembly scaffold protein [Cyclobacteriaceae bacterium]|nr:MAG: iron-sulfur cluster assembly scaffold protein [Cyclobacteriaceae bacterium]
MSESLKKLYNHLILDRQKDLSNFEKNENAQITLEAYNPVCGDQFKLYLDFDNNTISKASYYGYGCSLSRASTSLLVELLPGKSGKEVLECIQSYYRQLEDDKEDRSELIKALSMAKEFPGRKQCVVLSWDTVKHFIQNKRA